jgi:hypothetical protein
MVEQKGRDIYDVTQSRRVMRARPSMLQVAALRRHLLHRAHCRSQLHVFHRIVSGTKA